MPSQTDFINEVKTLLMKFPALVLIRLVNENKHHFLCVGKNLNVTSVRKTSAVAGFSPTLAVLSPGPCERFGV